MQIPLQVAAFFQQSQQTFPLFVALAEKLLARYSNTLIKAQKTQVSFCDARPYCYVWLPTQRKIKGMKGDYIVVTFGLRHRLESSRVAVAVEPYPGRWTHHVAVANEQDVDDELLRWIDEAHEAKAALR